MLTPFFFFGSASSVQIETQANTSSDAFEMARAHLRTGDVKKQTNKKTELLINKTSKVFSLFFILKKEHFHNRDISKECNTGLQPAVE